MYSEFDKISIEEKNRILLLHESKKLFAKNYETPFGNLNIKIKELIEQLNFQNNIHLQSISLISENERNSYITSYQDNYINGLFRNNHIINEFYENKFKNILMESVSNYSKRLEEFNNFLVNSIFFEIGLISEKTFSFPLKEQIFTGQYGYYAAMNMPKTAAKISDVGKALNNAIEYIKKNGVAFIFENLRKALLSGVGSAIQIALSFTGAGAIANEVAWAIMTLYDGYQLFVNNASGSLMNLVVDLICLLTAGSLGKYLGKFAGKAASSTPEVLAAFKNSGLGKILEPEIYLIEQGSVKLSGFLKSANEFMKNKMGIGWASNIISSVESFFDDLAKEFGKFFGSTVPKLGINAGSKTLVRAGIKLPPKFEVSALKFLSDNPKVAQNLMSSGKYVEEVTIKAAEKFANEYLKEKPTEYALEQLDKKFGTGMADLYAKYLATKKLGKQTEKMYKGYQAVDRAVDAIRGEPNPYGKVDKYVKKIGS